MISRQDAISLSDSDPIAAALEAADARVVDAQDFRPLSERGRMAANPVDKGFAIRARPQRKWGNLEQGSAMGPRQGPSAGGSAPQCLPTPSPAMR